MSLWSPNTYPFSIFANLKTHELVEVIFHDPIFHEYEKSQNLVIFPFAKVIFYNHIFHESVKFENLVTFPFMDSWRWDSMILNFMSLWSLNT
jgi:hypothetical protein